jgi:hypothetical protein
VSICLAVLVSTVEVLAAPALAAFLDLREQVSKKKNIQRQKNEEKNRKEFSERRCCRHTTMLQYLYFCTSKASKLSTCERSQRAALAAFLDFHKQVCKKKKYKKRGKNRRNIEKN